MKDLVFDSVAEPRFQTGLISGFALLALALAVTGIYSVISYSVTQRTHEIGVRMALGAQRSDVMQMVLGEGVRLAVSGLAVGVLLAAMLTRFLSTLLFQISATDKATFLQITTLLAAVALIASCVPAIRAMRVDPIVALRYE